MSKKKMTLSKLARQHWIFTSALVFLLLLIVAQFAAFYKLRHQLAFIDSLEKNNSQVLEEVSTAKHYLSSFGSDLNQIRSFLLLPTQDYDFSGVGEAVLAEEEEDTASLVFQFVESLSEYSENEERYKGNQTELDAFLREPMWTEKSLSLRGDAAQLVGEDLVYAMQQGEQLVLEVKLHNDGRISARSTSGALNLKNVETAESFEEDLNGFLDSGLGEELALISSIQNQKTFLQGQVFTNEAFQTALKEKGLSLQMEAVDGEEEITYRLANGDGNVLAQFRILKKDGTLWFNDLELTSAELDFMSELQALDTRTHLQVKVDEKKEEMDEILDDKAFLSILSAMGWSMGAAIESEDRISYPILDGEGNVLRLIYIDRSSAEVKVEWPGVSADLLTDAIDGLSGKKKAWNCRVNYQRVMG